VARPAGLEPATAGLAYPLPLSRPPAPWLRAGVRGLDYLFTVSGAARIVSTDPRRCRSYHRAGFPRDCHRHRVWRDTPAGPL